MDPERFDRITRGLSAGAHRRRILTGLLGAGLTGLHGAERVMAKDKDKCRKDKHCRDGKVCVDRVCTCPATSCCCNCVRANETGGDFISACHTDVVTREECIARCGPEQGHGFGCVAEPSVFRCGRTGSEACTRTPPNVEFPEGCGCLFETCSA